jgi:hypothetical protein
MYHVHTRVVGNKNGTEPPEQGKRCRFRLGADSVLPVKPAKGHVGYHKYRGTGKVDDKDEKNGKSGRYKDYKWLFP